MKWNPRGQKNKRKENMDLRHDTDYLLTPLGIKKTKKDQKQRTMF